MTLEEAKQECEEACPCRTDEPCGDYCACRPHPLRLDRRTIACIWPGHAAIARYGDLRALQGRVEQAARTQEELAGCDVDQHAAQWLRNECYRLSTEYK